MADGLGLMQGTVDVLILKTLAWTPMPGYGILVSLKDRTNGELILEDAALYQALHRLERKNLVESEWGVSDLNRRAKFYSITRTGRAQLKTETAAIKRYSA